MRLHFGNVKEKPADRAFLPQEPARGYMPADYVPTITEEGSEGNGRVSTPANQQCPYFEAHTVTLPVPGEPPFRTLTVPRCSMAETLRARLDTTPAGQEITKRLTATPQGGETRMLYGPDMQPMAAAVCLVARLEARCKPEFVRLLNTFALETTLPEAA